MSPLPTDLYDTSSKLFAKLKGYYTHGAELPPLISQRTAFACAMLYTVLFVAPYYLSPKLRSTPANSRDAPSVIRARTRAAGLTCLASTVITVYLLAIHGHATPHDVSRLLGLWPVQAIDIANVMGLVTVLFVGPLYASLIVESGWRQVTFRGAKDTLFDSWTGYRNFVVAPASEEIVFRSLVIPLFILAKMPPKQIIFLTPLIFGLAHVHHMADFCRTHTPVGRTLPTMGVFLQALLRAVFQFCYTSLFGFFAAFAFLRTGNLYAIILAHSFCNFMGFPRLWGRLESADNDYIHVAPDVTQGKQDEGVGHAQRDESPDGAVKVGNMLMQPEDGSSERARQATTAVSTRLGLSWTVVYYVLILAGAYGFYRLLFTLTESPNALVVFSR
ncbi:hypothetical protein B0A48_17912 [Cryoendolithus antarcticus]|uniref:intramembrane prenyl-peptidase Rce1 n=1 Tax=Cryoendolithus antarcticus TaxID=1507870 RepID=A0A1V8SA98_9PEZI|nr:hypothetical protein B0A48_17912 [Cryoendolithus antarcticus]